MIVSGSVVDYTLLHTVQTVCNLLKVSDSMGKNENSKGEKKEQLTERKRSADLVPLTCQKPGFSRECASQ